MEMGKTMTAEMVDLLRTKAEAYRMKALVIEDILAEVNGAEPQPSVRELVEAALIQAPEHKLTRKNIIEYVKQVRPELPHIAVVSTLHAQERFRRVGKDEYQLKQAS